VRRHQMVQPSLRDWIRVNAFVIVVPVFMTLLQSLLGISNSQLLTTEIIKQLHTQQDVPFSDAVLAKYLRWFLFVLLVYSAALLVHIFYTFRLLRQYRSAFGPAEGE
jgi:hypothetical protein